jgi:hypothetical protein
MPSDACAVVLLLSVAVGTAACATVREQRAQGTESLLMAAGFRQRYADTPEKVEHLKAIPPLKITMRVKDGDTIYTYADPEGCNCMYVGGPKEYQEYKRLEADTRVPDVQRMDAEQAADWSLNWGTWGAPCELSC